VDQRGKKDQGQQRREDVIAVRIESPQVSQVKKTGKAARPLMTDRNAKTDGIVRKERKGQANWERRKLCRFSERGITHSRLKSVEYAPG